MKQFKRLLALSVASMIVGSLALFSIVFLGVGNDGTTGSAVKNNAVALLFWISLITAQAAFWTANSKRRKMEKNMKEKKDRKAGKEKKGGMGLFSFFRNIPAAVFDLLLILSVIMILVITAMRINSNLPVIGTVSLLYLSVNLHSVFNGRNYRFLKKTMKEIENYE
jgi:hypothetical protein